MREFIIRIIKIKLRSQCATNEFREEHEKFEGEKETIKKRREEENDF